MVEQMRKRVETSGKARRDVFRLKAVGEKRRVRFLCELDDAFPINFHDKFNKLMPTPCKSHVGELCEYCGDTELRTREQYAVSVYNYDERQVQVFIFAANRSTPYPHLLALLDSYGTIMDRDYVISRTGSGTDTAYAVIPGDKAQFKIREKTLTQKQVLEIVFSAFGDVDFDTSKLGGNSKKKDDDDDEDEDPPFDEENEEEEEEEKPRRKPKKRREEEEDDNKKDDDDRKDRKGKKAKDEDADDDDDLFDDEDEDDEEEKKPKRKSSSDKSGKSGKGRK